MFLTKATTRPLQENTLIKSISRFMPYWPLFSILLLLVFSLCFFYSVFTPGLYEASATILIHDNKKGAENSKQIEELDVLQAKKIIDNETDVVVSKPLVLDVIKSLILYSSVYKKKALKDKLLYANAPVKIESADPDLQADYEKIPFKYNALQKTVIIDNHIFGINQWYTTKYGKLRFLPNPVFKQMPGNTQFSFSLENPKTVLQSFQERLKSKPTTKLSSIIELTLLDESPVRAEAFLKGLANAYINMGIKEKSTLADKTLSFIDQRINAVEKDISEIEQKKQQYSAKNGAFDISTQGRLFLENVSANDQKVGEINMGLAVLNELDDYLATDINSDRMVPSTLGISDPLLSQMVEKLYNTQLEYESLKKTAGENNPLVLPYKSQIEKIKPDIQKLIGNQRRNLQASKDNIYNTNNLYNSLLSNLPKTERELVDLDREENIKSGVYSLLLQKKEEAALSRQSVLPEARLISTNISERPVSPNMLMIYLFAALATILSAMAIVGAKESFGKKVLFRDQIEKATSFPVIGEISIGASRDPIVISDNTKTFIAEQFRRLRMSLFDFNENSEPKKILITSAISGEGKSFIASNLALALALSGKKVALLDFDLNNPSLNNKLNISRDKGITDFLLKECTLEEIIHPTDLDPNLFLVLTGLLPHNPTELLMNGRTEQLLQELAAGFDYIVIDTAPVIPVTDAYIISKFCDVTLYVIRHKYTPKIFLERMDEENQMHKLKNVGIIFNSISSRGIGNNNYGYGYGYGYTYENKRKGKAIRESIMT